MVPLCQRDTTARSFRFSETDIRYHRAHYGGDPSAPFDAILPSCRD